ncbi:MAG: hypothetical protein ACPGSM_20710 [Thiolinea sp.]
MRILRTIRLPRKRAPEIPHQHCVAGCGSGCGFDLRRLAMYENHALEAKKIEILQRQLDDQYRHDKSAALLLKLGFFLTFLLYLMFNQHLYLGDATTWGEYLKDGTTAAGFGFMVLLVSLMALFLAWVKHHAYLHFGFFGQVGTVVVVVIGFALFAEFFSSSANQDVKSGLSLKNNEAYQQTLTATQGAAIITPNARLAEKIATAQQKLARCEEKLKQGREPHCKGDKAKLDGLLAAEARATDAQKQASVEQLQTNYARQDKLKADSYNPVIVSFAKFFAQTFGGNYEDWIKTAVVVVMLIVAVCFEILHHWLSKSKEASYRAIQGLELELAKLTGSNDYQDFDNSRPTPKEKTPMGFGTPAMAQFKYQQQQPDNKPAAGFIRTDAIAKTEKPTTKKKDFSSTWNAELGKSGIDSPADPAMNRHADKDQIERIVSRGLGTEEHQFDMPLGSPHAEQPHAPHARVGTDEAYQHASDAPAGTEVDCPQCGTQFKKRNQQHRFCKKECRFTWHNERDPKKQDFLKQRNMAV